LHPDRSEGRVPRRARRPTLWQDTRAGRSRRGSDQGPLRSVEQPLGPLLEVEPGVLMLLAAGDRRDALHEIKQALCRVSDYAEL
jgi:hypothetical protein